MALVFLSAGHGGADPGAVANGIQEKNANLDVMLACRDELNVNGVSTATSRTRDENDPVAEEVREANVSGAVVAIDFHENAGGGRGSETYYHTNDPKGRRLAELLEEASKSCGQTSRGIKNGNGLYFVNGTHMTAALTETAFLDSDDVQDIDTLAERQKFGRAYAHAILTWLIEFGYISDGVPAPTPTPTPVAPQPSTGYDAYYAVRAGKIYPEVRNTTDYAGVMGKAITDLAVRISSGSLEYRVHVLGGDWLPWVSGCNWNDYQNGYAGNGKAIDCIQIRTGSDVNANIQYRVSPIGQDYLPWVTEASDYAGIKGRKIDRVQIKFDR